MPSSESWNARYRETNNDAPPAACDALREYAWLLPDSGQALDLACGRGGNALLLAAHGLDTHAWDYADTAIAQLQHTAQQQHLPLQATTRDVIQSPPEPDSFDVIVVSRFLERELAPALIAALRPQGLLFYQTFTQTKIDDSGPKNPAFRLADNELLALFSSLKLLVYQELGQVGELTQGLRNEAMLVGQKVFSFS